MCDTEQALALGCHLSTSKGYEAMGETAVSIGATTFAFFTRNPRGGNAKAIDPDDAAALRELLERHRFGTLVAHSPYTMNLCSANDDTVGFARRALAEDIERMESLPGNYLNFHPGSHVKQGVERGIELIVEGLDQVLDPGQRTTVLLETMAGKGSEVGRTFEELRAIIDRVRHDELLGVCLDTCHVNDAGYDIAGDLDGVLEEFDRVIGLERLKALHLNDSKNPLGARKDRHERIGEGTLGLDAFARIVRHPLLRTLPMVLETPNDLDGYKREIELLRELAADTGE
jgi:deoxyribonuclease-4